MHQRGVVSAVAWRRAGAAGLLCTGILLAGLLTLLSGCGKPAPDLGKADYAALHLPMTCA